MEPPKQQASIKDKIYNLRREEKEANKRQDFNALKRLQKQRLKLMKKATKEGIEIGSAVFK